jgi:hypothetical protein
MSYQSFGFEPIPQRLVDIFRKKADTNFFFKIPVFQRELSWGKNEITKLLDQISTCGPNGHFIGTIFTSSVGSHDEIIDGQQRLTCLSLSILALCVYIRKFMPDTPLSQRVEDEFIHYLYIKSDALGMFDFKTNDKHMLRLRLSPGTQSKNYIDYVMILNQYIYMQAELTTEQQQLIKYYKNRKMHKAYMVIYDWITKLSSDPQDIEIFLNRLLKTRFVLLRTITASDAADLFDGLNSTGLHLSVSDIVKNKVLGNYYGNNSYSSLITLADASNLWEQYTENIEFRNQTQYLKHVYYTLLTKMMSKKILSANDFPAQPVTEKDLPELYDYIIKEAKSSDIIIRTIKEGSEKYKVLINPTPNWQDMDDTLNKSLFELNLISAQPAFSLLLFLETKNYDIKQYIMLIQELGKLFARQHITGQPKISFLDRLIVKTINTLSNRDLNLVTARDIMSMIINHNTHLGTTATTSAVAPRLELLKELSGSLYDTNRDITRYLLIKLANQLDTSAYAQDKFHAFSKYEAFRIQGKKQNRLYTIEHIMPQNDNLSEDWINNLMTGSITNEDPKVIHGQYLHMLGNLTLSANNSHLSNADFATKQTIQLVTIDQKTYQIGFKNGEILNSFEFNKAGESLANATSWNAEKISQRTDFMANELLKVLTITINGQEY